MRQSAEGAVEAAVQRFMEQRRLGRRMSVDEAIGAEFTGDRNGLRTAVLRALTRTMRTQRVTSATRGARGGSSSPQEGVESGVALPELGGYDVIDVIGRGGMGIVYEAYQQSTGRRVAVKFMLEGFSSSEAARRRFEREVELAAGLQHAGIVSVMDSGVHRGRNYYVMEYVEGRPLDEYMTPGECETGLVLSVMAELCETVDFAHQRGVLHRDLKPANIMVVGECGAWAGDGEGKNCSAVKGKRGTGEGARGGSGGRTGFQTKILDFGLAKALDAEGSVRGRMTLSEPGQLVGTLGYMAPEQARGDAGQMSVRSDVYSLGAIAYELLTGRLPVEVEGPIGEVLNRIAESEPARPSMRRRGLNADVDAMLLKALEKSPARRYATAAEFGEDLRRYLAHRPIVARRTGAATRVARWVQRNRALAGVSAAALVLLSVVTTVAFMRVLSERDNARKQAHQTQIEAEKTHRLNEFFMDMLAGANPEYGRGAGVTVREMLDQAAHELEGHFADIPEVKASLHGCIARSYAALDVNDAAERHLRAEIKLVRALEGESPGAMLADALTRLARIQQRNRDVEAAEASYREALSIQRRVLPQGDEAIVRGLTGLGALLFENERSEEAGAAWREARELMRADSGADDELLASLCFNLGNLSMKQGRLEESERYYREAVERVERRGGSLTLAEFQEGLAGLYYAKGDFAAAARVMRSVVEVKRHVLGRDHPLLAQSLSNLASVLVSGDEYGEAERALSESLEIRRSRFGPRHYETAKALNSMAWFRTVRGQYAAAAAELKEALDILESDPRTRASELAWARMNLGESQSLLGQRAEAERNLRAALGIFREGRDEGDIARCLLGLYRALMWQRRPAEALAYMEERSAILCEMTGPRSVPVADLLLEQAKAYRELGALEGSESLVRESLMIRRENGGEEGRDESECWSALAVIMEKLGRADEAENLHCRAVEMRRRRGGKDDVTMLQMLERLGTHYLERGQPEAAETVFREGLERNRRDGGAEYLESRFLALMGRALCAAGNVEQAESLHARSYAIRQRLYPAACDEIAESRSWLGETAMARSDYRVAESWYRAALESYDGFCRADEKPLLEAVGNVARALNAQGRREESEALLLERLKDAVCGSEEAEPPAVLLGRLAETYEGMAYEGETAAVRAAPSRGGSK